MKILSIALFISAALSCGNATDENKANEQETATVTENIAEQDAEQETMLTGVISLKDLQQAPYSTWFEPTFKSYEPSAEVLEVIDNNIHDYEIEVFMGTWCADSQREVPKLFKILEEADYNLDKLEIVAVDRNKTLPENLEHSAEFQMVPTIIFYKNGKEINRFVEFSQESFEEDIAKIVSGEEYTNPYAE
jgi:thiol-disulfide isomerase/thioredoxin